MYIYIYIYIYIILQNIYKVSFPDKLHYFHDIIYEPKRMMTLFKMLREFGILMLILI